MVSRDRRYPIASATKVRKQGMSKETSVARVNTKDSGKK